MHEELWTQSGLTSVLIYLLDHDDVNQKTIVENTTASTMTINKIQLKLQMNGLITIKKGLLNNQSLFSLTDKGRRVAEAIKNVENLL